MRPAQGGAAGRSILVEISPADPAPALDCSPWRAWGAGGHWHGSAGRGAKGGKLPELVPWVQGTLRH